MSVPCEGLRPGQPGNAISPFIIGGAMGPVTIRLSAAQAHADAMTGIVLSQPGPPLAHRWSTQLPHHHEPPLRRPDLRNRRLQVATYAVGQLARPLGLPLRCGAHYTASKIADGQAMTESVEAL